MSEGMFRHLIYNYFIKSTILKKEFMFKRFFRSLGKKQVPRTNKKSCPLRRDKGFFKLFFAFLIRIFGGKK